MNVGLVSGVRAEMSKTISAERVRELLSYDPETGVFTQRTARGGKSAPGRVAGFVNKRGYVEISVACRKWLGHRLAWFYVYGTVPETIDHINGNTTDNRIVNLRAATQTQNLGNQRLRSNNTSGFKGVTFCKCTGRWQAQIRVKGRSLKLGRFDTPAEAHVAYCRKATEIFGEFANFG